MLNIEDIVFDKQLNAIAIEALELPDDHGVDDFAEREADELEDAMNDHFDNYKPSHY